MASLNTEPGIKQEHLSYERIYEENAKVAAIFWEWRHKVMTNFFTGNAALFAVMGWLYQQAGGIRFWFCGLFLLGGAFAYLSYLLDERNKRILEHCYRLGSKLEPALEKGGGIFSFLNELHYTGGSYTQILKFVYLISTVVHFCLSVIIIVVVLYRSA